MDRRASWNGVGEAWRPCDYWYDGIRLTWRDATHPDLADFPAWTALPDGWTQRSGDQRRRAANERNRVGDAEAPAPSAATWTYAASSWIESWRTCGLPEAALADLTALEPSLLRVDLSWRGRSVETLARLGSTREPWLHWVLDDWETCADAAYVAHERSGWGGSP